MSSEVSATKALAVEPIVATAPAAAAPADSATSDSALPPRGTAGRTDYGAWDRRARDLAAAVEAEAAAEAEASRALLGLDGRYARSQAEAEERQKLKDVRKVKKTLEQYQKRETQNLQDFPGLLGPVDCADDEEKSAEPTVVRITRDRLDAGKRVVSITDTRGRSPNDAIVLTQDLSSLESRMVVNEQAKHFTGSDAENAVPEEPRHRERTIFGIIKCFVRNVHDCTLILKCKVISGTLELHDCSNLHVRVESEATVATVQVDLSEDLTIDFLDAPSGKNTGVPGQKKIYWGEDKDDRIFHAGVSRMKVRIFRDGFLETKTDCDYLQDGATAIGNAKAEEFQFITSVIDGSLVTEEVVRAGGTTGKNVRAMTPRELEAEAQRRQRAADLALNMAEDMIQIKDKDGNVLAKRTEPASEPAAEEEEEILEEVYTMPKDQIQQISDECDHNKVRGNEAFAAGEYAQAILLYSLALDKADELPDAKLYPRDVLYSNRAACFLKLGQHEKADDDAQRALAVNPDNIKANFRHGLALHAMGRFAEALPVLAKAHKIEPHNKQVKQALQFCEVRLEQERRKMMER